MFIIFYIFFFFSLFRPVTLKFSTGGTYKARTRLIVYSHDDDDDSNNIIITVNTLAARRVGEDLSTGTGNVVVVIAADGVPEGHTRTTTVRPYVRRRARTVKKPSATPRFHRLENSSSGAAAPVRF